MDAEQFLELLEKVEEDGGMLLDDPCAPTKIRLETTNSQGKKVHKNAFTTGCGNQSRMAIPYDLDYVAVPTKQGGHKGAGFSGAEKDEMRERNAGVVTVCAVDDWVDRWPRFQ